MAEQIPILQSLHRPLADLPNIWQRCQDVRDPRPPVQVPVTGDAMCIDLNRHIGITFRVLKIIKVHTRVTTTYLYNILI